MTNVNPSGGSFLAGRIHSRRVLLKSASAVLAVPLLGRVAAAQSDRLTVVRTPPTVRDFEFDPRNRPATMPPLKEPEAAVCRYSFGIETNLDYRYEYNGTSMTLRLQQVALVTQLEVDVWTPRNARRKLIEHEQGHRRIAEYYYTNAEAAARAIAEPLMERRFTARAATEEEARKAAVAQVVEAIQTAYLKSTSDRCDAAQQRFDDLTAHGTADIEVDAAFAQAVAPDPEPQ